MTQRPHGPSAEPLNPTTATAWMLTLWLPKMPPSGVTTGRKGTSTRTCVGAELESNEMHGVSGVTHSAGLPGSVQPAQSAGVVPKFRCARFFAAAIAVVVFPPAVSELPAASAAASAAFCP